MVDYNPNIPQGTDNLSTSQGQMLNNFTQLNTIFDFDHFTWNDPTASGADRGFHRKVTFPVILGADPAAPTSGVLYTKNVSAVPELFFENSAATVTQLTGFSSTVATNGSITFQGGLIMKWGSIATVAATTVFSFPVPFPTAKFSLTISPGTIGRTIEYTNFTVNGFTLNTNTPAASTFTYIALGN
jgi:hypothetical protein